MRMVFRVSLMAFMELIPLERLHALNAARYRLMFSLHIPCGLVAMA
ncbi:hypothetical protein J7K52_02155 [Candidatus Bathyarchaeota archaeon]|nr:hypothetical protein [Candidatus Bathyarchaeota archaeon]